MASLKLPKLRGDVLTIPNALSFYRLLAAPAIIWLALEEHRDLFVVLLCISLITDILDGLIARTFRMESKLGARLDSFADDLEAVVREARASAQVTHLHPEGEAGAIAVALVAAVAWKLRDSPPADAGRQLFETVIEHTPASDTRDGIEKLQQTLPNCEIAFNF